MVSACNGRTVLAEQVRFEVALRHFLNAEVAMRGGPSIVAGVVFKNPVISGPVIPFTDVTKKNALAGFAGYRRANGVPEIWRGIPATRPGVSQIAGVVEWTRAGNHALFARRGTVT